MEDLCDHRTVKIAKGAGSGLSRAVMPLIDNMLLSLLSQRGEENDLSSWGYGIRDM